MPSSRLWTRRTSTLLTSLAVAGALHAMVLLVLGMGGAPTLALSLVAVIYAAAAGRSARLLHRGALDRLPVWLALWAGSTLGVVGVVGATFRPGAMFWWSAAGAVATWGLGSAWLGRRVVAEAHGGQQGVGLPATEGGVTAIVAPPPNESSQLTEPRAAPVASATPAARPRS